MFKFLLILTAIIRYTLALTRSREPFRRTADLSCTAIQVSARIGFDRFALLTRFNDLGRRVHSATASGGLETALTGAERIECGFPGLEVRRFGSFCHGVHCLLTLQPVVATLAAPTSPATSSISSDLSRYFIPALRTNPLWSPPLVCYKAGFRVPGTLDDGGGQVDPLGHTR
ncbi:hypothetical protein NM688_g9446 [Phlebia brevispora]|uniref:Uncharacterized protein n=1 Tax=Phlebia brevispora TaxID=194682 RepID=A0ACC1RHI0_9APHY|nr:hypothetical protein NM688_g9446 [Phlebia brevispora]